MTYHLKVIENRGKWGHTELQGSTAIHEDIYVYKTKKTHY